MELTKTYTSYRCNNWDGKCPNCKSKNYHATFKGEGSWYVKYRCDDCKVNFAFNQGDAMGGQSDYIEIYEPNQY